jgi:glycosyltransferase involved in cell wall biosynthesis
MIVARVIRDEGLASALRRTRERFAERVEDSRYFSSTDAPIVNLAPGGTGSRTGGVAVQLRARLRAERAFRPVALVESLPRDAKAIHLEGTSGAQPIEPGLPLIISVHDFTLLADRSLLRSAKAVIFASPFLLEQYRMPDLAAIVIEPGLSVAPAILPATRAGIAFAGAVQRHKGGHLLPDIARELSKRHLDLHVFGRGDSDLLQALRLIPNVKVHGYYPAGTLPSLLEKHGIGLVLIPSIVPEAFSLTLSEAWSAGAAVAAFDLGAPGERIRRLGGGWLAPLESGVAGMIGIVDRWMSEPVEIPASVPTAEQAARAHLDLYRKLGLLS